MGRRGLLGLASPFTSGQRGCRRLRAGRCSRAARLWVETLFDSLRHLRRLGVASNDVPDFCTLIFVAHSSALHSGPLASALN